MDILFIIPLLSSLLFILSTYSLHKLNDYFASVFSKGLFSRNPDGKDIVVATESLLTELSEYLVDDKEYLSTITLVFLESDRSIALHISNKYTPHGISLNEFPIRSSISIDDYSQLTQSLSSSDHAVFIQSKSSCKDENYTNVLMHSQLYGQSKGIPNYVLCYVIHHDAEYANTRAAYIYGYTSISLQTLLFHLIRRVRKTINKNPEELIQAKQENYRSNYNQALIHGLSALDKGKNKAGAYHQIGISQSGLGQFKKAYVSFQKAAILDEELADDCECNINYNWATCINTGLWCFDHNDILNSTKYFELATNADPRNIKGWFNLAASYNSLAVDDPSYREKSFVVADTLMALITEEDQDYGKVLELVGRMLIAKGEKQKAIEIIEMLMRDDPVNAEIAEEIGNDYLRQENFEDAAIFFQMAANGRRQTETESFDLYYNMGVCHLKLDQFLLAADAFQSAMILEPDKKAARYSLLLAYYSGEFWDGAIMQGQAYTEKFPYDARGWQILSLSFSKKGMKIKAEEAARKYEELTKPDNSS